MKEKKKKRRVVPRVLYSTLAVVLLSGGLILAADAWTERQAYQIPRYEKEEMQSVIEKEEWTQRDYDLIYHQTGLGKAAADALRERLGNGTQAVEAFERYQTHLFADASFSCEQAGVITWEEKYEGDFLSVSLVDLQEGDILITKAGHSLGWRHGHAALVVDAEKGYTLEAVLLGQNSAIQSIQKWKQYPTLIQLRLRQPYRTEVVGRQIAWYTLCNLNDIPYGLAALGGMKHQQEQIRTTQCAYQVWQAYASFGFDIDSNGGFLVIPSDLVHSPYLEVVQAYGVDLDTLW